MLRVQNLNLFPSLQNSEKAPTETQVQFSAPAVVAHKTVLGSSVVFWPQQALYTCATNHPSVNEEGAVKMTVNSITTYEASSMAAVPTS